MGLIHIDLRSIFTEFSLHHRHPSTNTAGEECGVACLSNWSTVKKKPLGQFRSHLLWNYVSGFVFYHIHFHLRIGVIFRTRSRSWSIGSCTVTGSIINSLLITPQSTIIFQAVCDNISADFIHPSDHYYIVHLDMPLNNFFTFHSTNYTRRRRCWICEKNCNLLLNSKPVQIFLELFSAEITEDLGWVY